MTRTNIKIWVCLLVISLFTLNINAQTEGVSISTNNTNPDPSAMLDVQSTSKGVLIPRMTTEEREAIVNPALGLLVFDVNLQAFFYSNISSAGTATWLQLVALISQPFDTIVGTPPIPADTTILPAPIIINDPGTQNISLGAGNVGVGCCPGAGKLTVMGDGATSSTTAVEVLNSSSQALMVVLDDGSVGIGTNTPTATLDVSSTSGGFLPPRLSTAQRDAIASPQPGLMIFNTSVNKHQGYNGTAWNDMY